MRKTNHQRTVVLLAGVAVCVLASGQTVKADYILGIATKVPNVNSSYGEDPPDISGEGLELYFSSDRRHGTTKCHDDIWVAKRATNNDPLEQATFLLEVTIKTPAMIGTASLTTCVSIVTPSPGLR